MNGMKLNLTRSLLCAVLISLSAVALQAVNIWPDKLEPPVSLAEALQLGRTQVASLELDPLYCVNATLLNGEGGNTDMGYWLIGFSTELGNNYSTAVRMDGRVSVQKVKEFNIKLDHPWPETVTPPISVESALSTAVQLLQKQEKKNYYCLNATLVTGSNDVVRDGMWNFVFQTESNDPKLVNIRMNGKTSIKSVERIRRY